MNEKVRMPGWAIGLIWGLLGTIFAGGVAWGAQRKDVSNLNNRVSALEALPSKVASLEAKVDEVLTQNTEMRSDIKTLLQRGR